MIRISPVKKHEQVQDEGLRVHVEGAAPLALTSPEAQRMVFNYVKEAGLSGYGMNKFMPADSANINANDPYPYKGYWLMLPSQWNQKVVKV
jgi:hypothetical protein